eukprot:g13654.t1
MGLGLLHPFTRPLAYYLVHSWRVYGFLPALGYGAITRPLATFLATLAFLALRLPRDSRVAKLVHAFAAYGSSSRPRFVRAQKEPYTKAYFWPEGEGVAEDVHGVTYEWRAGGAAAAARRDDEDKEQIAAEEPEPQYIISLHPHGILCCGWFNLIGRFSRNWSDSDRLDLMDRLKLVLCFAPAVQHMPLHGDMYRQNCSDATSRTLARILSDKKERKSVAIAPGGFSEACYTGASENQEVAYLLERYGFIKLAIEQNVDIIPVYSFGNDAMYRSWDLWGTRHRRAVYAQKMGVPLVFWDGWDGLGLTNIPKTEDVVTVSFDPFRIGKYRQEWLQLELEVQDGTAKKNGTNAAEKEALVRRCHFDYLKYLAKRFEDPIKDLSCIIECDTMDQNKTNQDKMHVNNGLFAKCTENVRQVLKKIYSTKWMKKSNTIFEKNWFEVEEIEDDANKIAWGTMIKNEKGVAGRFRCNLCNKCHLDDVDKIFAHARTCRRSEKRQQARPHDVKKCKVCSAEVLCLKNHINLFHKKPSAAATAGNDLICKEVNEFEDEILFAECQIALCRPDSVVVGTQNVQSLHTKDAGERILEKLRARVVDALSLQEVNIRSLADIADFCQEVLELGYSIVFCPQSSRGRTQGSSLLIISSALGMPEVHVALDNDGVETILVSCERAGVEIDLLSLYAAPGKLQSTSFAISDDVEGRSQPVIVLGDLNARDKGWDVSENKAGQVTKQWMSSHNVANANTEKIPTRVTKNASSAPDQILFNRHFFEVNQSGPGPGFSSEKTAWSDHNFTTCTLKLKDITRDQFAYDVCETEEEKNKKQNEDEFVQAFTYATNEQDYDEWHAAFRAEVDKNMWEMGSKLWPKDEQLVGEINMEDDPVMWLSLEETQAELQKVRDCMWPAGVDKIPSWGWQSWVGQEAGEWESVGREVLEISAQGAEFAGGHQLVAGGPLASEAGQQANAGSRLGPGVDTAMWSGVLLGGHDLTAHGASIGMSGVVVETGLPGAGDAPGVTVDWSEVDMDIDDPGVSEVSPPTGSRKRTSAADSSRGGSKRQKIAWDSLDAKATWKEINTIRGKRAWGTGFPEVMVSGELVARQKYLQRNVPGLSEDETDTIDKVNNILKEKKVAAKPNLDEKETDQRKIIDQLTDFFRNKPFQAYKEMGVTPATAQQINKKTQQLETERNEQRAQSGGGISAWPLTLLEFRAAVNGLEAGRSTGYDLISHEMMKALRGSKTELILFRIYRILLSRGEYPKAGRIIKLAPVGLPTRCPSFALYWGTGLPEPSVMMFVEAIACFVRGVALGSWELKELVPFGPDYVGARVGPLTKKGVPPIEDFKYPSRESDQLMVGKAVSQKVEDYWLIELEGNNKYKPRGYIEHDEGSYNAPGRFSKPKVVKKGEQQQGGNETTSAPFENEAADDTAMAAEEQGQSDAQQLGQQSAAVGGVQDEEDADDEIDGYATDEDDAEGHDEDKATNNQSRAKDINPIWDRKTRPFTEIFNEHLNDFPHYFNEVKKNRINFGRRFWRGGNVDVYDMDRLSAIVLGKKLSVVRDKSEKDLGRARIACFVECLTNVQLLTGESVVCSTDGCVSTYEEVDEAGDCRQEKRAGAAAVLWFGDHVSPVAADKIAVLGVCGVEADSFDTEAVGVTLAPDLVLKNVSREKLEGLKSIILLTDSNSLLSALLNYTDASSDVVYPVVRELERLGEAIGRDIPIKLFWCPGHQKNLHNDAADFLAGRAIQWGPIGSKPARFAVKIMTPSILRRELYRDAKFLRPPNSVPASAYMKRRFDVLGPFRPPQGTFPAPLQEFLYLSLWVGFARAGMLGMTDIFYDKGSKRPSYCCAYCGKKAECLDHFLFQCTGNPKEEAEQMQTEQAQSGTSTTRRAGFDLVDMR